MVIVGCVCEDSWASFEGAVIGSNVVVIFATLVHSCVCHASWKDEDTLKDFCFSSLTAVRCFMDLEIEWKSLTLVWRSLKVVPGGNCF